MKETDLDYLCVGALPDEIRHIYKMVNEWGNGDSNSFPVQLALLQKRSGGRLREPHRSLRKNWPGIKKKWSHR